jgi:IclR family transcriptional regulator, acetate operon repressor
VLSPAAGARARGVQSVDRALDILELLAAGPGTLGVTEVARGAGLPPGTAHRLLVALAGRGWVRQDAGRRYGLGPAALVLRDASGQELASLAAQSLRDAVEATGETANLAVLDGDAMVYLAQAPSPHTLRIFAEVGRRVPLHSTAVGKVALAALGSDAALARVGTLPPPRTPRTLTSTPALRAELDRVRELGHAVDDEEQETGVRCVAVPVPLPGSPLVAALSVSGPTERLTRRRAEEAVPVLQQVATDLAHRLRVG